MKLIQSNNIVENYLISNSGVIWNIKKNLEMKCSKSSHGYLQIRLMKKDGTRGSFLVHRLVMQTFKPENELETVNHIDGNKLNNSISNLEWMSRIDNVNDAKRLGYNVGYTDISEKLVLDTIKLLELGNTTKEIMKLLNVSRNFVSRIRQGERHSQLTKHIVKTNSRKLTLENKKDICYLIMRGISDKDIVSYFKLSKNYVSEVRKGRSLKNIVEFVIKYKYKPSETIERVFKLL